jgi:hypothetical protein
MKYGVLHTLDSQACSLFVWLVVDGWCWFVLREKYCWLVADGWFVVREKYCWLVADKPSEQADGLPSFAVNLGLRAPPGVCLSGEAPLYSLPAEQGRRRRVCCTYVVEMEPTKSKNHESRAGKNKTRERRSIAMI